MKMNKRLRKKRVFFLIITCTIVLFIFSQSCLPARISSNESGTILNMLNALSELFGVGSIFTANFVRKCAHFTEFAALGVFMRLLLATFSLSTVKQLTISVLCCLSVAVCDETVQHFVPGRACTFSDVMLDFIGSIVGLLLASLSIFISKRIFETKNRGKI